MNNKGFTLIELLVVIVIIGILAAGAISAFGSSTDKAKISTITQQADQFYTAVTLYNISEGSVKLEYGTSAGSPNKLRNIAATGGTNFTTCEGLADVTAPTNYGTTRQANQAINPACNRFYFEKELVIDNSYMQALPTNDLFPTEGKSFYYTYDADTNTKYLVAAQIAIDSATESVNISGNTDSDTANGVIAVGSSTPTTPADLNLSKDGEAGDSPASAEYKKAVRIDGENYSGVVDFAKFAYYKGEPKLAYMGIAKNKKLIDFQTPLKVEEENSSDPTYIESYGGYFGVTE